jgi:ethanolamine ammonia-lyase small subunit
MRTDAATRSPGATRGDAATRTAARLSLGRTASALSTTAHLDFQLDHALARDAVHAPLDVALLSEGLRARGFIPLTLRSAAPNRATYLRRPDLGRTLHPDSITLLNDSTICHPYPEFAEGEGPASTVEPRISTAYPLYPVHCLFILADGLSALALERHALPLLDALLPLAPGFCLLSPVVSNARVAIGDQIGELLEAEITVLLIGERPGLSSPDSLGAYITWHPRTGRTDAERNCISNIRAEGLGYAEAAHRIAHYLHEAARLQTTGIILKDPDPTPLLTSELKPLP